MTRENIEYSRLPGAIGSGQDRNGTIELDLDFLELTPLLDLEGLEHCSVVIPIDTDCQPIVLGEAIFWRSND